jgi:hypothetical protein
MNPPSHFLVNATLRKWASINTGLRIPRSFLVGSLLPDLPLTVLWVGSYLYIRYIQGEQAFTMFDERLDQSYFSNPFWIASHNVMHGPLWLLVWIVLLWRFRMQPESRGGKWFWFVCGCLMHTTLDIPTHVNDGPLLFWPLEWSVRFYSPISYWDQRYYGREFGFFELALNILLLGYLIGPWVQRRWRELATRKAAGE